jgi:8-oxo-dGTP pyrophosphatase MutT (NUDIX family)
MPKKKSNSQPPIAQASAVPFRKENGHYEFCLITSVKRGRWIFPKGIIDPGETYVETALKEAYEEAGIRGEIVGEPIGSYQYAKWGTTLTVTVAMMQVESSDDQWPEADLRQRRWATASEARELLSEDRLRDYLDLAVEKLP